MQIKIGFPKHLPFLFQSVELQIRPIHLHKPVTPVFHKKMDPRKILKKRSQRLRPPQLSKKSVLKFFASHAA
jgi:hypothetical protein